MLFDMLAVIVLGAKNLLAEGRDCVLPASVSSVWDIPLVFETRIAL